MTDNQNSRTDWTDATTKERNAALEAMGLRIEATYLPPPASAKWGDFRLRWSIELSFQGRSTLTTEYTQGIGHLPGWSHGLRPTVHNERVVREALRNRRIIYVHDRQAMQGGRTIPAPELADVVSCLILDGSAIDYATYEDWADNYGYDRDSREGERIYRVCLTTGLRLRAALGDKRLQEIRVIVDGM